MSGECSKCNEHTLECMCKPYSRRQENGRKLCLDWISTEEDKPKSHSDVVLVTDGILVNLAHWISNPKYYYEPEEYETFENWEKEPHWYFFTSLDGYGPFIKSKECFGKIEDITHWMPLPEPPAEFVEE